MARILIVDDSPADLKLMESVLQTTPHDVVVLNDPARVEELVARERPDLLLLDVVMPGRNGYEVMRGLRRTPQGNLKVILVSSKGNDTDVKWGLRQGADDYLVKPYTPEQVLAAVTRHLG